MADEEKNGAGVEGAKKAGKKSGPLGGLSTIIIVVAAVLVGSALSAFLAVTFVGKGGAEKADAKKEQEAAEAQFGPTQDLGSFTVNVSDSPGSYIKAGVAVEAATPEAAEELTARDPQVKDAVVTILGQQTMAEVSSADGKANVKKEILAALNRFMTKGKVKSVFFTEFVFQ